MKAILEPFHIVGCCVFSADDSLFCALTGKQMQQPQPKAKQKAQKRSSAPVQSADDDDAAMIEHQGVAHDGVVEFVDTPVARAAAAKTKTRKPGSQHASGKRSSPANEHQPRLKAASIQNHKKRKGKP